MTEAPKKRAGSLRWAWITAGLMLFLALCTTLVTKGRAPQSVSPTSTSVGSSSARPAAAAPNLIVTIQTATYEHGYLKIVGAFENAGSGEAFSPSAEISVWDSAERTLLARESARPVVYFLKKMPPGASAAFEAFVRIPGEPGRIKWRVELSHPGEVKMPKK